MPAVLLILVVYAFGIVLLNRIRPLITLDRSSGFGKITTNINVSDSRFKKYFACRDEVYNEYNATKHLMQEMNCNTIGLELGHDDWEYPLFLECYHADICPININVDNVSKSIPSGTHKIDCIVSTTTNKHFIEYKGRKFYNLLPAHTQVWIYK